MAARARRSSGCTRRPSGRRPRPFIGVSPAPVAFGELPVTDERYSRDWRVQWRMNRLSSVVAAFGLAIALSLPAAATSVLPLYLEELVDMSTVAFEGTCTENRTELEAATQIVVTYTTFTVHDVLKGSVGSTYVIKQIGGSLPGDGPQFYVHGIPKFAVGDPYVVFMAGVSAGRVSPPRGPWPRAGVL